MREIPDSILESLSKGEKFVYCFEIIKDKDRRLFTSHDKKIIIINDIYLQYSGLNITNFIFNDSSKDNVEIKGIFESKGISETENFTGYSVKIDIFFLVSKQKYHLLEYSCSNMTKKDLCFTMILEPLSTKLHKNIIETYGTNCRASLGDNRCMVDKSLYPQNIICDKKFITCCNKFNNAVNFRGEPFIPEIT